MSHFKPLPRHHFAHIYDSNEVRMEGEYANYTAALLASEACFNKCSVGDATPRLSEVEGGCLRQCFIKYFDCELLVQNEMTNFVMGTNM